MSRVSVFTSRHVLAARFSSRAAEIRREKDEAKARMLRSIKVAINLINTDTRRRRYHTQRYEALVNEFRVTHGSVPRELLLKKPVLAC